MQGAVLGTAGFDIFALAAAAIQAFLPNGNQDVIQADCFLVLLFHRIPLPP